MNLVGEAVGQPMAATAGSRSGAGRVPGAAFDMLVLQMVGTGPLDGFDISQRLDLLAGGELHGSYERVYPTLHRLEQAGLLTGAWREVANGRAKLYRLTSAGRARLHEGAGWTLLSDAMMRIAALQHEQRTAAAVQRALLPKVDRAGPFFETAAMTRPCLSIGGDFFDYFDFPNGGVGFVLGDVAGKGPQAALVAALMQGAFAMQVAAKEGPAAVVAAINGAMCKRDLQARFVTLFYGVLLADGGLTYCNAGHEPPMVLRVTGGMERLDIGGTVIGVFGDATYAEGTYALRPGDAVVASSDGVSEARNLREEEFGEQGIMGCVSGITDATAERRLQRVIGGVGAFQGRAVQHDDMTVMVMVYRPMGAKTATSDREIQDGSQLSRVCRLGGKSTIES